MLCDTCGIPYLQGYQGFIDRDLFSQKISSDCCLVGRRESIIDKLIQ